MEAALTVDPDNEDLKKLKTDLQVSVCHCILPTDKVNKKCVCVLL